MKRPKPPQHLDSAAVSKWAELLPALEKRGDLDQGTLDALAAYCVAYSQWVEAQAKIAELGSVIKSASGFAIISPFVTVAAQAERRMRQWATELRLTPKARGKATSADGESAVSRILMVMDDERETA
ncbi:MAG: phage terminase small subunit P27 family [Planctomycetales bacterium]|nr:phage terminase small subunit P27 family [Planctomycetales bacterium]